MNPFPTPAFISRGLMGLAAVVSLSLTDQASAAKFGDLTYEVKNSSVTITDCRTDAAGALVVPAKIGGKPVTKIGDYAFYYCTELTEVTLPAGVTNIGRNGFSECAKLRKVNLPAGLKSFGTEAFGNSDLRKVKIPGGVETVTSRAFVGCFNLNSVELSEGIKSIEPQAFAFCTKLESVTIPASATHVITPSFADANLLNIEVAAGNKKYRSVDGVLYNKDRTLLISCPARKDGTLTIPGGVKWLAEKSFYKCRRLKIVKLPASLVSIESRAFSDCNDLTEATLPSGLTRIGHHAFVHTSLGDLTIPASVKAIGGYAFVYCRFIKNVTFNGNAPSKMGAHVFDSTSVSGVPADDFKIYFYEGSTGFTEPTWMGYDTVSISPDAPATNRLLLGTAWRN